MCVSVYTYVITRKHASSAIPLHASNAQRCSKESENRFLDPDIDHPQNRINFLAQGLPFQDIPYNFLSIKPADRQARRETNSGKKYNLDGGSNMLSISL